MSNTQTQSPATPKYNNIGSGAIKFLRSPLATLIVLCSALLAQLPHAADVFRMIVAGNGWPAILHGFTYALALELAVLLFVVQHRNVESYIFAAVSILVNLSYYYLHGVALLSIAALPAWLVSIALPAAIAQYSHLIVAATEQGEAQPATVQTTAKPATRRWWQFWRKPVETPTTNVQPFESGKARGGVPVGTLGHSDGTPPAEHITERTDEIGDIIQPDTRTQAMQLRDEGYTAAEIARMTGAKYSTVQSWLRRATVQTNGVHQ